MAAFPSMPPIPKDTPYELQQYLAAMQQIIELLSDQRGSGELAAVVRANVQTLPISTSAPSLSEIALKFNSLLGDLGSEN